MRARVAGVMVLAGLAAVAPALGGVRAAPGAVRLRAPGGHPLTGRWQSWADASRVPTVSARVTVRLTGCPALPRAAGCVYTRRPRVIYLRPGLRDSRGILLHELGHVFDLLVLNNGYRARFRRVMGQPRTRLVVREDSARRMVRRGYSWCARYSRIVSIERYAGYHYRPGAAQHRRVCALIERAARDRTPPVAPKAPPPVIGPDLAPAPAPSTAPGTVPGDPRHDPGPGPPESPTATPTPTATPVPTVVPVPPLPVPTPTPRA